MSLKLTGRITQSPKQRAPVAPQNGLWSMKHETMVHFLPPIICTHTIEMVIEKYPSFGHHVADG